MKFRKNLLATFFMLAALFAANIASAQSRFNLRQVLRTGDNAPVPQQLSFISDFSFNSLGQTAYIGDDGLFLRSNNVNSVVAGFGDAAPGGGAFISAGSPTISSNGQLVFRGEVLSPSTSGLFSFAGGKLTQLVADGSVAASGDVILAVTPSVNDAGAVAFINLISGGLFVFSGGHINKIVNPGDPAPGGDTFIFFSSLAINHSGQIVFDATLASGNEGFFLASNGTITKVIEEGDTFPDGGIFAFPFGAASINDAGDVAFAGLTNGPSTDSGVFLYSGGQLSVVVPAFTPIASLGGALLEPQSASINNAGQIAFISQEVGSSNSNAFVFVFGGGNIAQIAGPGQSSPEGDIFSGAFNAQVNNAGQVGFLSREIRHNDGLFLSANGTLSRIAGQGDTIARQPKFQFPFAFGLSNQDEAFVFDSTFPGGTGLFSATPSGAPNHVVLDGHVGQSVGNDGVIQGFFENFVMNSKGQVAFNADLSGGISSIFLKSGNTLTQLVRATFAGTGDPAPGGGTFLGVRESSINNLGQIAFSGFDSLHAGIYLASNGQLSLAIDGNTPLPEGGGTFGTVSLNAINDLGQISFLAQAFPNPNAIYVMANGQFTRVARDGDLAPGGGTFSLGFPDPRFGPVINNNTDIAFAADLSIGGRGVFLFSKGTVTRIAGPGDSSPDGGVFLNVDAPTMNASGQIAFAGETTIGFGAFAYINGAVVKVAAPGDTISSNNSITAIDLPQINDRGEIAFGANLATGENAIFIAKPKDSHDPAALAIVPGPAAASTPHSRRLMKAKHPRNFILEKSPNDHGK